MTVATTHHVPYFSQWESAGLVPEFVAGTTAASADPLWESSGADSSEEYAFWAPRMCGMACLRMALGFFGQPVPPSVPLVREALAAGAYVRDGDQVQGLIYAPFAAWVASRWGLFAEARPQLSVEEVDAEILRGRLVLMSVHKTIRTLDPRPEWRGGHLVLAVGSGPDHVTIHNPSGFPEQSQQFHQVSRADLARFFAGRGSYWATHSRSNVIPFSLAAAALATDGRLSGGVDPDSLITGPLVFDSRDITPGSLFCCLAGKSVDGHDFAAQAVAAGAVAVLASRPVDAPAILVPDVLEAMGRIAARVSSEFTGTVIGLTGSAGKTSTKDLLTSILELDGPTVATPRSFNNEIGFPVTVSRVEAGSRYLLLEMGARGLGHIDSLCDIARPTISTVLGVGSAHIGEFGSREVTAQAKAEIVRALPAHGTAVLNGDDPLVSAMAGDTDATVITFGFGEHCDIRAEQVGVQHDGRPHFVLVHGKDRRRIELRVHGRHNVLNALAAAATAIAAGVPADRIAQGLRQAEISSGGRMEVTTRGDGVTVINDAFNASPESVLAALTALGDIAGPTRRKVAVLGEMAELGDEAADWHDQVAAHVVRLSPAAVIGIGSSHIDRMLTTITAAGLTASKASDGVPLVEEITRVLRPGDVVLVKGANSLGLEAVARELAAVPTS